ncbi:MAG: AMP-binding protein [Fusobacteria bacterium]|nr:AMP-binding protein [Fusobacteriota bacterium]
MKFISSGTRIIMRDMHREFSADKVLGLTKSYAKQLKIESGDKVVLFSQNQLEYAPALLSIWMNKGVAVMLDANSTREEFQHIVCDSGAKFVMTSKEKKVVIEEYLEALGLDISLFVYDEYTGLESAQDFEIPELSEEALIIYTSGTTGSPKGVVITFENIYTNMRAVHAGKIVIENYDNFFMILPQHHIFPLLCLLTGLHFNIALDFVYALDSESLKAGLIKFQPTVFPGVPRVFEMFHKGIMSKIRAKKLSSTIFKIAEKMPICIRRKLFKKVHQAFGGRMELLVSGGAKLPVEVMKDFRTLGFDLLEGYGMTECAPLIAFSSRAAYDPIGCIGKGVALAECDIKISEEGEVLVKGPHVMKGYFNNEAATKTVFTEDGYFMTGDRGEFREGFLYLEGRIKDMIILTNGKNVDPNMIEQDIIAEDKIGIIQEVAVVEFENKLLALVFPNMQAVLSHRISNFEAVVREVLNQYNTKTKSYLKVLDIKIVQEEFEKTRIGKIKRFKLKDIANGTAKVSKKSEMKEPTTESYGLLKKILYELKQCEILPDSHIEFDLGLDSLEFLELQSYIKRTFGIYIEATELADKLLVHQLAEYVEKHKQFAQAQEMNFGEMLNTPYDLTLPKGLFVWFAQIRSRYGFKKQSNLIIKGLENIPERNVIFAGNHQSFVDAFIFWAAIPYKKMKNSYFIAKHTNFDRAWKRFLGRNVNTMIMDMNENAMNSVQAAAYILKKNKNLIIFPEGTRTPDGAIYPFKRTFAELSATLKIPVVPFVIYGAFEAFPKTSRKLKQIKYGDIIMEFLPPIESDDPIEILVQTQKMVNERFQKYKENTHK